MDGAHGVALAGIFAGGGRFLTILFIEAVFFMLGTARKNNILVC